MLQRLGVAQALLSDPDLLLIDEPTSGLDLAGQREVIELLASVRDRGHTIFLCTHYLQEVELLCDRVGVLAGGRIAAEARMRDLRDVANSVRIRVGALDTGCARNWRASAAMCTAMLRACASAPTRPSCRQPCCACFSTRKWRS